MVHALRDRILALGGDRRPLEKEEMLALARDVDLAGLDLSQYRQFDPECYKRNRVLLNEHLELVVICWKPGQASAVHDHARSRCLYLVVEGRMQEDRFVPGAGGEPVPHDVRTFDRGAITMAVGAEIHRIRNDGREALVTVHLYSPPIDETVKMFTEIPRGGFD